MDSPNTIATTGRQTRKSGEPTVASVMVVCSLQTSPKNKHLKPILEFCKSKVQDELAKCTP
jgi:hypothetical protein